MSLRQKKSLLTWEQPEKITQPFPSTIHLLKLFQVSWPTHAPQSVNTKGILKKAQQRLYFLSSLKKFGWCTIESVLTFGITSQGCQLLQQAVKTPAKIVKTKLPKLCGDYISCCTKESLKPHEVATLPVLCSQSFRLKKCYRSIKSHTNHQRKFDSHRQSGY